MVSAKKKESETNANKKVDLYNKTTRINRSLLCGPTMKV